VPGELREPLEHLGVLDAIPQLDAEAYGGRDLSRNIEPAHYRKRREILRRCPE
jgi:hypothetical protein